MNPRKYKLTEKFQKLGNSVSLKLARTIFQVGIKNIVSQMGQIYHFTSYVDIDIKIAQYLYYILKILNRRFYFFQINNANFSRYSYD